MNPEIAIAGAGPVGLLSAINLVKNKIAVRIFESRNARSELSRALVIHAGTLELLEAVNPELLQRFLARGKKIQRMEFGEKYSINLELIPSRYNFILVLEQQETEEILENYLIEIGGKVERSCKIFDAQNEGKKIVAAVENDDKKFYVSCDYLLDCSGAHSVIRKNVLQIPFLGEKYFGKIIMGDIKINLPISDNVGHGFRSDKGFAAAVPLNHAEFFRVILMPNFSSEIPAEISLSYFRNLAKIIAPQLELSDESKWLTSFEISRRMAQTMRAGRIFLAGDAAHIHSPVGGQGMNLGMQDSFNICDKISQVLRGNVDEKILDDYEKQRLPIIAKVLKLTNAAMRSGVERTFLSSLAFFIIQKFIAPIFFRSKFLQMKLCELLSQVDSARAEIKNLKFKRS